MNSAYLALLRAQLESLEISHRHTQRLAVDHAERLVALQITALREFTRIAMAQLRAGIDIMGLRDPAEALACQSARAARAGTQAAVTAAKSGASGRSERTNVVYLRRPPSS